MTTTEVITWVFSGITCMIALMALFFGVLYPRFWEPKPRLTCSSTPHWVSPERDLVTYDLVIRNEGNAPAKGIGVYLEVKNPSLIRSVQDTPEHTEKTGGEDSPKVELRWEELSPGNLIHTAIMYDASADIESLHPERYKVWFKDKLLDSRGV